MLRFASIVIAALLVGPSSTWAQEMGAEAGVAQADAGV